LNKIQKNNNLNSSARAKLKKRRRRAQRLRYFVLTVLIIVLIAVLYLFVLSVKNVIDGGVAETTGNNDETSKSPETTAGAESGQPPVSTETNVSTTSPENTTGGVTTAPFVTDVPPEITTKPPESTSPPEVSNPAIVKPSAAVDDSYFSDAVFIGDSRTQGLELYGKIKSTYYADRGLDVSIALTKKFIKEGGEKITLIEALEKHPEFKKIYISLGVNEYWMSVNAYKSYYIKMVDEIRKACPNAKIYLQAIFPLSDDPTGGDGLNNEKMAQFNEVILEIAETKNLYYIDLWNAFKDLSGRNVLTSDITSDGVHLNVAGVKILTDYLRRHT